MNDVMIISVKGATDRRLVRFYGMIKIIASVYQTGGDYFFRDLLPSVYPSPKQVKPKLKTAMRPSRVNIGIPPLL